MSFFEKYSQNIKICKNNTNGGLKFVTIRNPKTASNSLKLLTKSKIITKGLKIVERDIFDLEPVTLKHPKFVTKLSKPIKQPKK